MCRLPRPTRYGLPWWDLLPGSTSNARALICTPDSCDPSSHKNSNFHCDDDSQAFGDLAYHNSNPFTPSYTQHHHHNQKKNGGEGHHSSPKRRRRRGGSPPKKRGKEGGGVVDPDPKRRLRGGRREGSHQKKRREEWTSTKKKRKREGLRKKKGREGEEGARGRGEDLSLPSPPSKEEEEGTPTLKTLGGGRWERGESKG